LGERFNGMKTYRITNFDFMQKTCLALGEEWGNRMQRKEYLAVSAVRRAAEGEI
jgi:hypothetical protein